jgi:murein DD-endopeptidase MepM/ murein hydrolase activator NlpD
MKLINHIRFSIIIVTAIFIGSALLGKIYLANEDHRPFLQAMLDHTETLIHRQHEQPEQGRDFIAAESYSASNPAAAKEEPVAKIAATIKPGESIDTSLKRQNISTEIRVSIINALRSKLDFKRIKPEDNYTLQLDSSGDLESFRYESGPLDILTIKNSDEGYRISKDPIELERKKIKVSAEISSSLFAAFADKDEDMRLVYAFADIFASKIDFNTEIQPGDRFALVVDKYHKNGKLVGYGKIEVAQYFRVKGPALTAYLYTSGNGKDQYFDQDGLGVGASFLRSPVPVGKMTSKFTYQRRHPITGKIKPHLGVDLAAPVGTPIMAVADGKIIDIGPNKGYGNQVVISHNGDFKTYYGHLSRFKSGLHRGSQVGKKDIIGYVGSTGMSTGPHLDYRVQHHTVFEDPFAMTFKAQIALSGKEFKRFKQETGAIAELADLGSFTPYPQVLKVSNLTITKEHDIMLL